MELILKVVIGAIILLFVVLLWKPIGNITRSDLGSFFSSKKQLLLKIVVAAILFFLTLFLLDNQIKKVAKNTYINNFEEFVVRVQENHKEYSETEWEEIEKEYSEFEKERKKYKEFFTKEDEKKISELEIDYSVTQVKDVADDLYDTLKEGVNNAVKYIDGLINDMQKTDKEAPRDSTND